MLTLLRDEMYRFVELSSIRGLRRTLYSSTSFMRIFWQIFIAGCMVGLAISLSSLVRNFMENKDRNVMQTWVESSSPHEFPAITLCREHPYQTEKLNEKLANNSIKNITEYTRHLLAAYEIFLKKRPLSDLPEVMTTFDTPKGFVAQVPLTLLWQVVEDLSESVVYVGVNFDNGSAQSLFSNFGLFNRLYGISRSRSFTARRQLLATRVYHPRFGLCNRIDFNWTSSELKQINELQILMLNENQDYNSSLNRMFRAYSLNAFSLTSGVYVGLHDRSIHPVQNMASSSMLVRSGVQANLQFGTAVEVYEKCVATSELIDHGSLGSFKYYIEDCKARQLEQMVQESCNCTMDPSAWPSFSHCMLINWTDPTLAIIDTHDCYKQQENRLLSTLESINRCQRPACNKVTFSPRLTVSDWAINDYQWFWFWNLISNYTGAVNSLIKSSPYDDSFQQSDSYKYDFKQLKDVVNFITVSRIDRSTRYQKEISITTLAELISSIGGQMSIFMGVTFTFFAEIFELLYRVFWLRRKENPVPVETASTKTVVAESCA